jgi:hypothetical protein
LDSIVVRCAGDVELVWYCFFEIAGYEVATYLFLIHSGRVMAMISS